MKQIKAVVRPEKLAEVKLALDAVQCPGMMVWDIVGHGKQQGITEQFRGREFRVDYLPKTVIEVIANDKDVSSIITAIEKASNTGRLGDGKIFVSNIDDVIRIRTGEAGEIAVG